MSKPDRVSIRYSVDLEEVPARVRIMLAELGNSTAGTSGAIRKIAEMAQEDLEMCNEKMLKTIEVFKKMIIRVEDCLEISRGYLKLKEEPAPAEEIPNEPELTGKKVTVTLTRKRK